MRLLAMLCPSVISTTGLSEGSDIDDSYTFTFESTMMILRNINDLNYVNMDIQVKSDRSAPNQER